MQNWSRLKKTAIISAVTILGLGGLGALTSPAKTNTDTSAKHVTQATDISPQVQSENTQQTRSPIQTTPDESPSTATEPTSTAPNNSYSCPNGSYVNTDGITVCSPYSAPAAPAGATAQCVDGTYSFSQSHSGTCSHHGGVAEWL